MREAFHETLQQYSDQVKEVREIVERHEAGESLPEDDGAFKRVIAAIDWQMARRAKQSATTGETQVTIVELQQKKQEVMAGLRAALSALDRPAEARAERAPRPSRAVRLDGDRLVCRSRKTGRETEVSAGDILTDGVWDIAYDLDESVPKHLRKRYLVDRARRKIEDLLDEQIVTEELASTRNDSRLKSAYEKGHEAKELGVQLGFKAEKMLSQLAAQISIDEGLPYAVETADAYEDVRQKIDFIIRRKDHARGVRVEEGGSELAAKGLQVTVNRDEEVLARKRRQISRSREQLTRRDRVDDIALAYFNQQFIAAAVKRWEEADRPPGGPGKFLAEDVRRDIFAELTKGMEK